MVSSSAASKATSVVYDLVTSPLWLYRLGRSRPQDVKEASSVPSITTLSFDHDQRHMNGAGAAGCTPHPRGTAAASAVSLEMRARIAGGRMPLAQAARGMDVSYGTCTSTLGGYVTLLSQPALPRLLHKSQLRDSSHDFVVAIAFVHPPSSSPRDPKSIPRPRNAELSPF